MRETTNSEWTKYKARQVGKTVYVIAYGVYPNNRCVAKLERRATDFPPEYRLSHRLATGKRIEVETKFAVSQNFHSESPVEAVKIYDADNNPLEVCVEQTPDFEICREINKLLEKNIKYEKLSAGLLSIIREYEEIGVNAGVVNSSRVSMTPLFIPSDGGTPETIVSIRCDENADLNLPGVNVNSQKGELRTAKVSLDALAVLSQRDGVHRISSSVKLKPLNDVAAASTQLDNFRQNNNSALTGNGVVIGIVDTGIDSSHSCFTGRILSIWDQKIDGHGWGEKDYGMILTGGLLAASADVRGHGTHVAGIAAGRDDRFGGVAPEARLIIVKTDFIESHITDAIEYIFAEADKLPGKPPVVVNLSLGGHINAHDGSDDLSQWIDKHTGAGRLVVTAAGNEGDKDIHAAANIAPGETAEIGFKISQNQTPPIVLFSGWYDADGSCEISIKPPVGQATPPQKVVNDMDATQTRDVDGMLVILTMPPSIASHNGDHEFELKIQAGSKNVQTGQWHIIIRNMGATPVNVHIWSTVPDNFKDAEFTAPFAQKDMKIGSPGCAAAAITVASFVTRTQWENFENNPFTVDDPTTFKHMAASSSPGLTRDGRKKPDIAAPGEFIASALSNQLKAPPIGHLLTKNFIVNSGTSMACPFVTGICALLLEENPNLTPDEIREFLKGKGRIKGDPPMTHKPKWGFGLVRF